MKTKDEYAEDFIIDNLSFGELIALKYDIPLADDEVSGFDKMNFGGNVDNFDGLSFDSNTSNLIDPTTSNLSGSIKLNFNADDNEFSDFGKKQRQKVGAGIKNVGSKIKGATQKVTSGVKNTVNKVGNKIGNSKIGQAIQNSKVGGGVVSGLQKLGSGVKKAGSKIGNSLNNLKDKAGQKIKQVGNKLGEGLKKIGRGVVVATLSVPRASARTLISFNFRGFATRIDESGGKNNTKLMEKWRKLGGDPDKLIKSTNTGKNKKPLICGVKCKEKMVQSNFLGFDGKNIYESARGEMEMSNSSGVDVAVLVTAGAGVLSTIGTVIGSKIQQKGLREQLESEEKRYEQELDLRAKELGVSQEQLAQEFKIAETRLQNEADPIKLIQNNPDLSPQEKAEAIKQAQEVLDTTTTSNVKKYALYGGLGLLALFIGYQIFKPKKG